VAAAGGLRAICFPSSDAEFDRAVQRALAVDSVATTNQLETALRPEYPGVSVRPREISGEQGVTWYVYRDRDFVAERRRL
jgi:hypothetical protein